jgi:hypothetical protein
MRPSLSEMCVFALLLFAVMIPARAQDNYEIQEYSYDTVAPGDTMVELNSNCTADGSKQVTDGVPRLAPGSLGLFT